MLSQTQNQNSWASGPRGALPSTCVTLILLLTQTQTACLFRPERWKRFLCSLCSSRNNNSQGDFDSGYQETTSQTTSRYSSVSFSPVSCFSFFISVLSAAPIAFRSLSTGARLDGHIGVNLEHGVLGVVLEKHGQGIHFFWDTTGFGNARDDPDSADYALNGSVVGRPHHLKRRSKNR